MVRQRYPKRAYLDENDQLRQTNENLIDLVKTIREYHSALDKLNNTAYKADQMLVIQAKRQEMNEKYEELSELFE